MRNYFRIRNDTVGRITGVILCHIVFSASFSSLTFAKSTVTQKIGFAGGLESEESSEQQRDRSPIFSATSTNYHPSNFQVVDDHRNHRHHSHEDIRRDDKFLKRTVQYNKLPAYGPRSQPDYDKSSQNQNHIYTESPYRKIYSVAPPLEENYHNHQIHNSPEPEPKKYSFAYAVRDGYRGDDFSHKESRDGKVTMGEYKVLLPDGRLQVVRYTADALAGFKADVTYEGEDHPHLAPLKPTPKTGVLPPTKPNYYGEQSSAVHKKYVSPSPSPVSRAEPLYFTKVLKARPSLSPSVVYTDSNDVSDDHNLFYRSVAHHTDHHGSANSNLIPTSPSPSVFYKVSPTPYKYKKVLESPTPTFGGFIKNPGPTLASYFSSTPKNIYDKIHSSPAPSREPYSAIPRGYRAGPTQAYKKVPLYKVVGSTGPTTLVGPIPTGDQRKFIKISPKPGEPITRKSRLVPVEFFKAGPATVSIKDYDSHRQGASLIPVDYESNSRPQHYILEHADDHIVEEHYPYKPKELGIAPIKSSLATFTSSFGGGTPKPPLFIKSKPLVGVGRAVRPSISGLVYLETPGQGPRPNALGVKELLDRIPHGNLPQPKTTTHPYEVGAKDYGNNVGYGNSRVDDERDKPFIPSEQIPNEYIPKFETHKFRHHSREYLTDDKEDSIISYHKNDEPREY